MKNKLILLFTLTLLIATTSNAQDCNCEGNFEWVKKTFEENDAGFQYILDIKGRSAYDVHNAMLREKIKSAQTSSECTKFLKEWLTFFRSGHIDIQSINQDAENSQQGNNEQVNNREQDWWKPSVKELDSTTLLFRIPSFSDTKILIDSVILANKDKILRTKNLIIDVRDNSGGSTDCLDEIFPFLYTNPIRIHYRELLSTKLNNQRLLDVANGTFHGLNFSDDIKKWAQNTYDELEAHLEEFVDMSGSMEPEKIELDTVYAYPQNVGIIINGVCASTTEDFVFMAKQSKKVKLFGTTTFGAIDIGDMNFVESPCKDYQLGYAVAKSKRVPEMIIDEKGIQPDFFLDKTIPHDQWIDFVKEILNK
ncbi:hypothetical protein FACS1894176_03390 [Bacteroidia bacterium]|nr:hypothetical protein FACS1894176_03390 [Bacteroidia bacterium]